MRKLMLLVIVSVLCLSCGAFAGVVYTAPAGGWSYVYNGDAVADDVSAALDGTWDHKSGSDGSDAWDGSAIGSANPGGVSALTDGAITYIRIQDTGDPRDYGFSKPSNRKFTFAHNMDLDGVDGSAILDNGVTLSFRTRIPTTGPLDDRHPDGGGAQAAWTPAGYVIHSDGYAPVAIKQGSGKDGCIGFALALASDHPDTLTQDGLVVNNLVGNSVAGGHDVETQEAGTTGTLNQITGIDVTLWHEFWVTIEQDTTDVGTHLVNIWMDGNMGVPDGSFIVTAGNKNEYDDFNGYLDMSLGETGRTGAQDIDFVAYAPGVSAPVPEPTTIALLGIGGLALIRRKRS